MVTLALQNSFQVLAKARSEVAVPVLEQAMRCSVPAIRLEAARTLVNRGGNEDAYAIVRSLEACDEGEIAFLLNHASLLEVAIEAALEAAPLQPVHFGHHERPIRLQAFEAIARLKIKSLLHHLVAAAEQIDDELQISALHWLDLLCKHTGTIARAKIEIPTQPSSLAPSPALSAWHDEEFRIHLLSLLRVSVGNFQEHRNVAMLDCLLHASHWSDAGFQAIFSPFADSVADHLLQRLKRNRSSTIDDLLAGAYWHQQSSASCLELLAKRDAAPVWKAMIAKELQFGITSTLIRHLESFALPVISPQSALKSFTNEPNTSVAPVCQSQAGMLDKKTVKQGENNEISTNAAIPAWLRLLSAGNIRPEQLLSAVVYVIDSHLAEPSVSEVTEANTDANAVENAKSSPNSHSVQRQPSFDSDISPIWHKEIELACAKAIRSLPPLSPSVVSMALSGALHSADLTTYSPPRWKIELKEVIERLLELITIPNSLPCSLQHAVSHLFSEFTIPNLLKAVEEWPAEHTAVCEKLTRHFAVDYWTEVKSESVSPCATRRKSVLKLFQAAELPASERGEDFFEIAYEALSDSNPEVRIEAMKVLIRSPDTVTVIQCLEPMTRDVSTTVSESATELLAVAKQKV